MRWALVGYGTSFVLHVAIAGGFAAVPKPDVRKTTAIAVVESRPKPRPRPKLAEPEPPKPLEPPKPEAKAPPKAAPKPAAPKPQANTPPPAAAAAPSTGMNALPDFGLSLSGGTGAGGLAIPTGGGGDASAPAAGKASEKSLRAAAPKPKGAGDAASGEATKPKLLGGGPSGCKDEARAAGVGGRVRVKLAIDASGAVASATVLSGLAPSVDACALAAGKRLRFSPATAGGVPAEGTFTFSMQFEQGE